MEKDERKGAVLKDKFMTAAIAEARKGLREGGIPIGSVLVRKGKIIGSGRNKRIQENDPVIHAEIDCLRNAGRIGTYRNTTLYSTLMPCYLCAGAVVQFGIKKVVVGESKNLTAARKFMESRGVKVADMDLDECKRLMADFIKKNPKIWKEDIGKL
ncbi:MAG: nucleoside deaminase [Candidatus Aenigmatarchaeota archaeon]